MFKLFVTLSVVFECVNAVYLYDYSDDETLESHKPNFDDVEFEAVTLLKNQEKVHSKNINCDDFETYVLNCKINSLKIYNSSINSPPKPEEIHDWCKGKRYFMNCAIDWNSDCKDLNEQYFNINSIKGHMHIVNKICDSGQFLKSYEHLSSCIMKKTAHSWEMCFEKFSISVEEQTNKSSDWTHYEMHFRLCCSRSLFRRCTLEALFRKSNNCAHEEAVTLQKFSVLVSEGFVYQDCDHNVMYTNCPGGDPRPSGELIAKLLNSGSNDSASTGSLTILLMLVVLIFCLQ